MNNKQNWQTICETKDLVENSGVCALLESVNDATQSQIAIFHLPNTEQKVYAIGNYDPIGKANVLYRGIVGSIGEDIVVASPLYKQHYSLKTGRCLQEEVSTTVYTSRIEDNKVQILL